MSILAMGSQKLLLVGKIYRLKFAGIAARVIEPPPGVVSVKFPDLVESLFLRSRWWVNALGEPDNIYSPPDDHASRSRGPRRA